jgi:hypothetical protein
MNMETNRERIEELAAEAHVVPGANYGGKPFELTHSQLLWIVNKLAEERKDERVEHCQQWYAERWQELQRWAREDIPHPIRNEFFSIIANGTKGPNAPPNYARQLNVMRHRAERAEAQRNELIKLSRAVLDGLGGGITARAMNERTKKLSDAVEKGNLNSNRNLN